MAAEPVAAAETETETEAPKAEEAAPAEETPAEAAPAEEKPVCSIWKITSFVRC